MKPNELAVIEGRWFEDQNLSVGTVFNTLSDLLYDTPHGYFHHHFSNAASLEHVIRHVAARPEVRFLYVGAHGNDHGIFGALGDDDGHVSRTTLRNVLWRCWDQGVGNFDGLFLGSCSFVTEGNAEYLLCGEKAPKPLRWVAGYSEDVDWVDSTLLDVLFLKRVLTLRQRSTPIQRVEHAASWISTAAPGLCRDLGFQVYVRGKGSGGGVKGLIKTSTDGDAGHD